MYNKNGSVFFTIFILSFSPTLLARPSIEDFVKHARFESGKLSPSGKYLAVTRRTKSNQGILVVNLDTMTAESGTHLGEDEDVWDFFWANNERLLIEPALRTPATMSFKAPTGEILGMNADGSNFRRLSGFRVNQSRTGTLIYSRSSISMKGEIFSIYGNDKDYVLVQASSGKFRGGYSVAYRMDVNNGRARVVGRSKTRFGNFIADNNGLPSINFGENSDNETELYYRADVNQSFELLSRNRFGKGNVTPVAALPDGSGYYVLENKSGDTLGLSIWQPSQSEHFNVVYRHPSADINSVVSGVQDHQIIAIKYYDPLPNYFYPDESLPLVKRHQRLRQEFPDRDVIIESVTDNMSKAVINITGDIYPSVFYLLDIGSGDLERIFASRPELESAELFPMRPVLIPTRDNLELQGLLTLPKNLNRGDVPLVVLVHGGPYGLRDQWGYDFEVQLLANRGYAVLQVNFRGSPGNGLTFQSAGIGQWGAKMQDDITDATHWAIEQGIVNRDRICIYGSSYGGYAALMGVVREPDLYRCAIGYGGVYDLDDLFDRGAIQASASGESYLYQVLGTDEAELVARSPYHQAEKISAKVLIAHGRKDTIAPYRQAKNMQKALKKNGNEPEFFIERKEGHGFFGQRSRIRYYNKLLAFLDDNIGKGR